MGLNAADKGNERQMHQLEFKWPCPLHTHPLNRRRGRQKRRRTTERKENQHLEDNRDINSFAWTVVVQLQAGMSGSLTDIVLGLVFDSLQIRE